jgi:hypothetical protein
MNNYFDGGMDDTSLCGRNGSLGIGQQDEWKGEIMAMEKSRRKGSTREYAE